MHTIEPHFKWRDQYIASEDTDSPFYGRTYSEFTFKNKIYNYFIHPQWDDFGSSTLYLKILYVDYHKSFAIIELIGEWNDAIHNDVMFLKRELIDRLIEKAIYKFILISENVLNFHGSDDCYYEEWWDDIKEEEGWIAFLNILEHVEEEMQATCLQYYCNFGNLLNHINWRPHQPISLFHAIDAIVNNHNRHQIP